MYSDGGLNSGRTNPQFLHVLVCKGILFTFVYCIQFEIGVYFSNMPQASSEWYIEMAKTKY